MYGLHVLTFTCVKQLRWMESLGQPNSWQVMSWLFLCLDVVSSITIEWLWMELIVKNDSDAVCSKQ